MGIVLRSRFRTAALTPRIAAIGMVCIAALALPETGLATEKRWILSPLLGVHSPKLRALNHGEFKALTPGRGRLIFDGGDAGQDFEFVVNNAMPAMRFGTEAGAELGYRLDDRNTVFIGASSWESGSSSTLRTEIPFQGSLTPVGFERSARLSYFQYFLGWQRTLLAEAKKFKLHGRVAMHQVFDIDYKENLVFGFDTGTDTFKRIIVMESQATGSFMMQLGMSGEYFLTDWLSLGADLGYTASLGTFKLGNATLSTDIQAEDNLNFRTPAQLDSQQRLTYLAEVRSYDDVTYRDMKLGFDGWRLLFRANMYF